MSPAVAAITRVVWSGYRPQEAILRLEAISDKVTSWDAYQFRRRFPDNLMRFEASININATPESIWSAVADPEGWPRWTDAIHKVEKLSEGPLGVGSRLRITIIVIVPVRLSMTIIEFIPGQLVVMEGKALISRMTRYYRLQPQDGRTKVIAGGEVSGPMAPLVWLIGQVVSEQILQALKVKIEG